MAEETWRPLGVDDDESVAEYDALHDGVPPWMRAFFWTWIQAALTIRRRSRPSGMHNNVYTYDMLDTDLTEQLCLELQITLPNLRTDDVTPSNGMQQFASALGVLQKHPDQLQIADYLLAHGPNTDSSVLRDLLDRSKSAWTVGERAGRPGLVNRVPVGVQVAADAVMDRAGRAGIRLAKAWEKLYGLNPEPSAAYSLAIKAVEDAAVPVVSRTNAKATLGTVLGQMEAQGDWKLPMERDHPNATSGDVLISMMRMLWHGQHDRHGGQPSAPGDVSIEEAGVAVGIAVTLVSWFDAGLVSRATP